jgi:uncharacterized protein (DUF488 family)
MPHSNRLNLPSSPAKRQIQNKVTWNNARSIEDANFFTIGYSGRKLEEIVAVLECHAVRTLVDIRQNPVSMYRPELNKNNLSRSLLNRGIHYLHFAELGVPRDIRAKAIETGTRDVIWEWYDHNVVTTFLGNNLHMFLNVFEHPIALMCTEIDPKECHRHRLSLALEQMGLKSFDL